MKKNRDTVGVEKNKKTSSNAELQADKAKDEQPKASQKSDEGRRFTVSQRLIISVIMTARRKRSCTSATPNRCGMRSFYLPQSRG